MSRLIDRGRAMLTRFAGTAAGVPSLLYTQVGTALTCTLVEQAWVGRTLYKSNQENRPSVEWGERDYLIPAEFLVINGSPAQPQRGDRFTETLSGVSTTWEIMTPDNGEKAWRWADPQQTIYRVHCKRVA